MSVSSWEMPNYGKNEVPTAEDIRLAHEAAENGNFEAQFFLGTVYYDGFGVTPDDVEAALWFRKAADRGLVKSQISLGRLYAVGIHGQPDTNESTRWYRKAADTLRSYAEQGQANAQYGLGMLTEDGLGVPANRAQAIEWYAKAAAQQFPKAREALKRLTQGRHPALAGGGTGASVRRRLKIAALAIVSLIIIWIAARVVPVIFDLSPEDRLTEIAKPGAVVAVADTNYYQFGYMVGDDTATPQGTFKAGEHLCAIQAYMGDRGMLVFQVAGDQAYTSNRPGQFQPDAAATVCGGPAAIGYIRNPKGHSALARKWGRPLFGRYPAITSLAIWSAIFVSVIFFGRWLRRRSNRPGTLIPLAKLMRTYPGFAVREGDFEYRGTSTYRVNRDGERINLKKWHFDGSTGEFYAISRKVAGRVIFDPTAYSNRFVMGARGGCSKTLAWIFIAIMWLATAIIAAPIFHWREGDGSDAIYFYATFAVVFGLVTIASIVGITGNRSLRFIGPEPLMRAAAEFGGQQPHGVQDDGGTI
ncbi:MAG: tetratricopeptide repeat protein [Rhizomicrobium sp.]|nr:tetratricopeptide repeat protein [Rhizomicrobium sp.]